MPLRGPLVGVRKREHARFGEWRSDDLQADRKTGAREAARDEAQFFGPGPDFLLDGHCHLSISA